MKTPMQQMLELLEELLDSKPTRADRSRFETAIAKAKELMKLEEEVIVKAVYDGMGKNFDPNMGRAEIYYKSTFNTTHK